MTHVMDEIELVSVVIPTRNRPQLVCRAITSVLNQTYRNFEIVVVIDGPDSATETAIRKFQEPRIKIVALSESVGGSEARNSGVRHSRGEWIAFLDDDDEWLPQKLEKQINAIVSCGREVNFSACRFYFLEGAGSSIQPEVFPRPGQDIGEYLFCEITKFGRRRSFLGTPTWLVKRDLCLSSPFTRGLRRYQDPDWLLKTFANHKVVPCFVSDPYVLVHAEPDRTRVSAAVPDWSFTFAWANEAYLQLTPKAKTYIYGTICAREAKQSDDAMKDLYFLWKHCHRSVRFRPQLLFLFFWAYLRAYAYRHKYLLKLWFSLRVMRRARSTAPGPERGKSAVQLYPPDRTRFRAQ